MFVEINEGVAINLDFIRAILKEGSEEYGTPFRIVFQENEKMK